MHIKTTLTSAMMAAALLSTSAFAATQAGVPAPEAMKHSNPQAESAAQSRVDARGPAVSKVAKQPEAMEHGSAKAEAAADAKVAAKPQVTDKTAKQPEAMMQGSNKAKTAAEAKVAKREAKAKKQSTDQSMSDEKK